MIEAHGLTRCFGTCTAVSHISLHVPDGSLLALLGSNGAGKTTTVRMLSGLLAPTEGSAIVGGYDVRRQPDAVRACVGLVTDVPGLFEQMTVVAYLDFFGSIYGMPAEKRSRRIKELLAFFELTEHRKNKMVGFSKGMKQKVALARALMHEPAVLFLDEPTSGLDPLAARTVHELITHLKQESRSIILCTHDLDEAEHLADEVAIMRRGRIVASDTPERLRAHASSEVVVRIDFSDACPLPLEALQTISYVYSPQFVNGNGRKPASEVTTQAGQVIEYRTPHPRTVNPQVLSRLITAGAQIISVTCETSTLEDVYASAMQEAESQATQPTGGKRS
jgi:ABC-2 type transport system ATP-binding protein